MTLEVLKVVYDIHFSAKSFRWLISMPNFLKNNLFSANSNLFDRKFDMTFFLLISKVDMAHRKVQSTYKA